jgi:hypothetical protein
LNARQIRVFQEFSAGGVASVNAQWLQLLRPVC